MKVKKIKFTGEVLAKIFEEGAVIGIDKGIPKGSRLVKLQYRDGIHEAIFTHDSFPNLPEKATATEIDVMLTEYKKEEPPSNLILPADGKFGRA